MTNQNRPSPCVKQVSFQDEDLCQVFYMPQDARDTMLDILFYSPQDIRKFQDDKFEEEARLKLEAKQKEKLARKQEKEAKKQQRRQRLQARREKRQQQQQKKKGESESSTAEDHHTTQSSSSSARELKRLHSDDSCSTGDDWDSYLASTSGDSSGDYSSSDEHENDHTDAVTHNNPLDKLAASPTSVCHHDWASLSPSFVAEHGKRSPRRRRHQQQQSQQLQQVTPSKQASASSPTSGSKSPVPSTPPASTTSFALNTSSTPPISPLLKPNKELQDDAQNDHIHSDLEALLPTTSTASNATTSTISSTDTFVYLKQQVRGWRWATLVLLSLLVVSWIWFVAGGLQVVSPSTANGNTLFGGHPPSKQQPSVESVVQNTKRRRFLFQRR